MPERTETEEEAESDVAESDEVEVEVEQEEGEAVIDMEAAGERQDRLEELQRRVEEQQEEIDELNDLLLDLSVRVADGRSMGVCPECHGPVIKKRRLFRSDSIECVRCGETFHEY